MPLWSVGGFVLGLVTALMGRQGIWICTAAVEAAVHRHMDDQLFYLRGSDPELHALIRSIQDEELAHLDFAQQQLAGDGVWARLMHWFISGSTDVAIWLSTWGSHRACPGS